MLEQCMAFDVVLPGLFYHAFEPFGEQWDDFVHIAHDAHIGYAKNGCAFVFVDGYDEVGFFHSGQMLHCSRNA